MALDEVALPASAEHEPAGGGDGFVLLGLPDMNGSLRGKALRAREFEDALRDGSPTTDLLLGLDPVDEPITTYERFGIRAGSGDMLVRPELETLRELSWRPGWRVCMGTPYWPDGSLCELSPRETLRRALSRLAACGYEALAAFEYEVRLRDAAGEPVSSGISYSVSEASRLEGFLEWLVPALRGLGVELSAVHTEAGPGLIELNVAARPGLRAADDAAYTKLAVKEMAAHTGLTASFLAKTVPGEEGSSGHVHLSCWSDGANAFDGDLRAELPAPFAGAIAGVLEHLPAASLLLNPTINSYKRLVPGWFAPINVSWGLENRTAAVRAIRSAQATRSRIECRRPGADANPYLALAALAAAAADGIERGARPPEPVTGDACADESLPPLPGSLESAIAAFRADERLRTALGEEFSNYFVASREWELRAWREAVSDWERNRYGRAV